MFSDNFHMFIRLQSKHAKQESTRKPDSILSTFVIHQRLVLEGAHLMCPDLPVVRKFAQIFPISLPTFSQ